MSEKKLLSDSKVFNAEQDRLVWFISFESKRLAATGGLGDAVANLSESLAKRVDVTIFMPSHGRHKHAEIISSLQLKDSDIVFSGVRIGFDGSRHPYSIGMATGNYSGVNYILFKGADPVTSKWLDEERIYGEEITYQKMSLLARGVRAYAERKMDEKELGSIPSVIHMHDWHAVPAGLSAWEAFEERRVHAALLFTIHLLSFRQLPWHYMSADWSGLKDRAHYISTDGSFRFMQGFREVWDDICGGSFEKFGCYEADFVTSVSKNYLDQILAYTGSAIREKSGVVYNGCDWDFEKIRNTLLPTFGLLKVDGSLAKRAQIRKRLLEKVLQSYGKKLSDGPLVLLTGRLDRQKGVDILINAVPQVLKYLPDTRFLLLLLPGYDDAYSRSVEKQASKFPDNLKLIIGNTSFIYQLAYLASDIYVIPSRWEPFGITALEAMATGNPVVGSSTGGITETVVDLLHDVEAGTGILVKPEDETELAKAIVSLIAVMIAPEEEQRVMNLIKYDSLRNAVREDNSFASKLRERCIRRVKERFSWHNSSDSMQLYYETAKELAAKRAQARL